MTEVKPTFHGEDEFHGDNSGMHGRIEGNHTTRIKRVKYHIRVFDATFLTPSEDIRPYGTMMYSCLSVLILPCVVDVQAVFTQHIHWAHEGGRIKTGG